MGKHYNFGWKTEAAEKAYLESLREKAEITRRELQRLQDRNRRFEEKLQARLGEQKKNRKG